MIVNQTWLHATISRNVLYFQSLCKFHNYQLRQTSTASHQNILLVSVRACARVRVCVSVCVCVHSPACLCVLS